MATYPDIYNGMSQIQSRTCLLYKFRELRLKDEVVDIKWQLPL
jgi:hypothetical protein